MKQTDVFGSQHQRGESVIETFLLDNVQARSIRRFISTTGVTKAQITNSNITCLNTEPW